MKIEKIRSIRIKWIFIIIFFLILMYDFLSFLSISNKPNNLPQDSKSVIIVLTGGPNRIEEAYSLLESDYGKKLFIAGVNPIVKKSELIRIINPNNILSKNLIFNCCVSYESKSYNTQTNALEALKWLNKNDHNEILLVTSPEHMPRSIYEFRKNAPKIKIQPWIVKNNPNKSIINFKYTKNILTEYAKLSLTKLKYLFKRS